MINNVIKQIELIESKNNYLSIEYQKHLLRQAIHLCKMHGIEIPEELQVRITFILLEN